MPSETFQLISYYFISKRILPKLFNPEIMIRFGDSCFLAAGMLMLKATMNKNNRFIFFQYDIWRTR
ncbi:hypothetical protein VR7878_03942 [Vibrio ruber DSM 16370]|uniref:Uncharacterized protein n=1 Tax=Vibrio ruber (strain DSM 16370 / JCM 11486 / BCRC 17186 / CECT 7878 / LMG 23124 / VR1) TaxID=1123498 RepID=A0A1R4LTW8_VIBR1|nr:hypothetical protein VR7878_03942 [Vibrio ruber DSM 16370]